MNFYISILYLIANKSTPTTASKNKITTCTEARYPVPKTQKIPNNE